MPQSLSKIWLHIVFSTKNRNPHLKDQRLQKEVHAYLATICQANKSPAEIVGGVEDHVHVLCNLSKTVKASELVGDLKRSSSKWIKDKDKALENFYWQTGYGAFSVSASNLSAVRKYIASQADHHQEFSFQDEFRTLLKNYNIEHDERYVWD